MQRYFFLLLFFTGNLHAQNGQISCANTALRSWWDVETYDLAVDFGQLDGKITGTCWIKAKVVENALDSLQIDLHDSLQIVEVLFLNKPIPFQKRQNAYILHADFSKILKKQDYLVLEIKYAGRPIIAKDPPWDGGFVLNHDRTNRPWMGVACQGEGGSLWFPCKNLQSDEAEQISETYTVPMHVSAIGNGRLMKETLENGKRVFKWQVQNPINTYAISFYIGDFVHWTETMAAKEGNLKLDYYVLKENEAKAKAHFKVVKEMIACFEEKLGPYPFYADGYKLVEAPYLGMEHQSGIAYGNGYQMGYEGKDRSKSGVGFLFDFIIIHESGHEWFGNSITTRDKADTWIHEGFTTYTETIFAECMFGKNEAMKYLYGNRPRIKNNAPMQDRYDNCDEGSNDHYIKGAYMLHMIRCIMRDDAKFWAMLKEMNHHFYHQIIDGKQMEQFISDFSGIDFSKLFNQYLQQASIPLLQLRKDMDGALECRYVHCIEGFKMPLKVLVKGKPHWILPSTDWTKTPYNAKPKLVVVSKDFLVEQ